jgi:hypothetical protein
MLTKFCTLRKWGVSRAKIRHITTNTVSRLRPVFKRSRENTVEAGPEAAEGVD